MKSNAAGRNIPSNSLDRDRSHLGIGWKTGLPWVYCIRRDPPFYHAVPMLLLSTIFDSFKVVNHIYLVLQFYLLIFDDLLTTDWLNTRVLVVQVII